MVRAQFFLCYARKLFHHEFIIVKSRVRKLVTLTELFADQIFICLQGVPQCAHMLLLFLEKRQSLHDATIAP